MSISSAMYTGLTGLSSFGEALGVVGDNIANMSTTGFKYSQVHFEDLMSQMVSTGSGPGQEGRGDRISAITPIFSQGSLETSANDTDVAITGTGFLIVKEPSAGSISYTRDGSFNLNKDGYMVNAHGYHVQGKPMVNGSPSGTDTDILIQQNFSPPQASKSLDMVLNLDAATTSTSTPNYYTSALSVYDTTGNAHTLNMTYTKLAAQQDASLTCGTGASLAGATGKYWTISNGTTNYYAWYSVDGAANADPGLTDPAIAGYTAIPATGAGNGIAVLSTDTAAQVAQKTAAALAKFGTTATTPGPFRAEASTTTTGALTISSGAWAGATPPGAGTTGWAAGTTATSDHDWQVSATLDGNTVNVNDYNVSNAGKVGNPANMIFDNNGTLTSNGQYSIDLSAYNIPGDTTTNQTTLNLRNTSGGSTTQYAASSVTNYASQDGYGPGYLQRVSINNEGIITGSYSNGQITPLYQLTLARFNAPSKLHREGSNMYTETQDSGVPLTGAPSTNGLGSITSNSLEQSNVDLSDQFVHMIIYQRGFQANSRIITTSDTLLQEVLNLKQ
ncbi:MAG: flagellar hook protein FlgE [Desulfobaccales bacterium]